MSSNIEVSASSRLEFIPQIPKQSVQLKIFEKSCAPEVIVDRIASIYYPVDVYCWYEGTDGLPRAGAEFMRKYIFDPLCQQKWDIKFYLYSLRAWDFSPNRFNSLATNALGQTINRINKKVIECLESSDFFRYCAAFSDDSSFYKYIQEEFPKKTWLLDISAKRKECGIKVGQLFDDTSTTLLDCVKDLDANKAYSLMQYLEGYYLIRESVRKALEKGRQVVNIAFVLPNDEGKYYCELPKDIEGMLQRDFGKDLSGISINITFNFFNYTTDKRARPYIDKQTGAAFVDANQVSSYFSYIDNLSRMRTLASSTLQYSCGPRDLIHNLT